MKASFVTLLLCFLLSGCAVTTDRRRCIEYMWVPNVDMGHVNYNIQRPICTEWSKE